MASSNRNELVEYPHLLELRCRSVAKTQRRYQLDCVRSDQAKPLASGVTLLFDDGT
jgi:hypothetical protein